MRARGLRISLADVRLVDLRERLAGSTAIRWVAVVAVAEDMVTVPRREMHVATCAKCGGEAQVPFVPRGDRPVYCSRCFDEIRGEVR